MQMGWLPQNPNCLPRFYPHYPALLSLLIAKSHWTPFKSHWNPMKNMNISLSPQILTGLTPWLLGCLHLVVQNGAQGAPRLLHRLDLCIEVKPHNLIPKLFGSLNNMGETSSTSSSTYLFILFYLYWEPLYTQNRLQIVHHTTKSGTKKYTIGSVCIYIPSEYT